MLHQALRAQDEEFQGGLFNGRRLALPQSTSHAACAACAVSVIHAAAAAAVSASCRFSFSTIRYPVDECCNQRPRHHT